MDMTWVTDRIAVGGGIWNADNMADVAHAGITHIVDMQAEFDDTSLAEPLGVKVLWNPVDDDFQPKPPEIFQRELSLSQGSVRSRTEQGFHSLCGGVHRAPMMTLAVLCSLGWKLNAAIQMIETRRPVADFAEVYVVSVERFLDQVEV